MRARARDSRITAASLKVQKDRLKKKELGKKQCFLSQSFG